MARRLALLWPGSLTLVLPARPGNGLADVAVRRHGPYDLVFANILAPPLVALSQDNVAPARRLHLLWLAACFPFAFADAHESIAIRFAN